MTWDITKLSYQSPLVLDYYKGAPLLVLLATGRGDCARFNYPLTGYAAFVWNGSEWQQADEVRIPQALKVNLLSAEDVKRTEYLQGSVVTISDKKAYLGKWPVQQGTELGEVTQKYGFGDQSCGHIRSENKSWQKLRMTNAERGQYGLECALWAALCQLRQGLAEPDGGAQGRTRARVPIDSTRPTPDTANKLGGCP